jgi:hypothetical protein
MLPPNMLMVFTSHGDFGDGLPTSHCCWESPEAMLLMAWIKMQLLDRMVAGGSKDVRK